MNTSNVKTFCPVQRHLYLNSFAYVNHISDVYSIYILNLRKLGRLSQRMSWQRTIVMDLYNYARFDGIILI